MSRDDYAFPCAGCLCDHCANNLYSSDHTLDQALLQWKYEYLVKQEKWLIELMCGKREEEKQEEKQ